MSGTKNAKISIVVPCYNEEESIPLFLSRITTVAADMPSVDLELIFVDDGSTDRSLEVMRSLAKDNPQVRYISFSRNFGKEAALLAGLEASTGDFVAVMDADLQHPPELLPQMYMGIVDEGFDCVATRRVNRKGEPPIRSFFSKRFYRLTNRISQTEIVDGATDYRLMTRQMVDAILSLKEYNRFSKGLFSWVGFSTKWIEFQNAPRIAGSTKWNFWQLFLYSLDGIVAFSVRPLAISSFFGMLFCLIAILGAVFIVVRWLVLGDPVQGWASTVCIILFVGGIQLFCAGILGQYVAKSYLEAKGRPVYIVKEKSAEDSQNA
ncbi:MAG: glycosyltransferase family 2 protein [Oscillospiraceae bacterium]|nr:glycosyltransferase family 2 protein [Oscillospiraceae bacterium]